MQRFSRKTKAVTAFIIMVIAGFGVAKLLQGSNKIPQEFTAARLQGALISQTIVSTSNQSTDELAKINSLDKQGNYKEALSLTQNLVSQSASLRDQAVQLSAQVGTMTKSLSDISSFDARQAALESIASRLALINQLISYSGDLSHLLDVLQARFSGEPQTKGEVQGAVNQINTDVNAINNFNAQATQSMEKFDKILKG